MTLFIISLSILLVCIIGILGVVFSNKSFGDTYLGPICLIVLVFDIFLGLIVFPTVREVKTEYVEIKNPVVLISNDAVIVDLTNSPNIPTSTLRLQKFNTYKAVIEHSDSTMYFLERHRSFYNVPMSTYVVWSNPPYKEFYKE